MLKMFFVVALCDFRATEFFFVGLSLPQCVDKNCLEEIVFCFVFCLQMQIPIA